MSIYVHTHTQFITPWLSHKGLLYLTYMLPLLIYHPGLRISPYIRSTSICVIFNYSFHCLRLLVRVSSRPSWSQILQVFRSLYSAAEASPAVDGTRVRRGLVGG
ncbi:hypothetical protein LY76DRAFT_366221 [Colletotrichum caudatum]|nr:hypothetical protein LY76DRAFT_366221 [Colletotrichum caudatum]